MHTEVCYEDSKLGFEALYNRGFYSKIWLFLINLPLIRECNRLTHLPPRLHRVKSLLRSVTRGKMLFKLTAVALPLGLGLHQILKQSLIPVDLDHIKAVGLHTF